MRVQGRPPSERPRQRLTSAGSRLFCCISTVSDHHLRRLFIRLRPQPLSAVNKSVQRKGPLTSTVSASMCPGMVWSTLSSTKSTTPGMRAPPPMSWMDENSFFWSSGLSAQGRMKMTFSRCVHLVLSKRLDSSTNETTLVELLESFRGRLAARLGSQSRKHRRSSGKKGGLSCKLELLCSPSQF